MRKVVYLAAALVCSLCLSAKVTYIKTGMSLFGFYKYVTEYTVPGETVMTCSKPGFTRCKPDFTTGRFGSLENFYGIDDAVMNAVKENNRTGALLFNNEYYVRYNYQLNKDKLTVDVYTLEEARSLGFNI